jgi:hypothetical protein
VRRITASEEELAQKGKIYPLRQHPCGHAKMPLRYLTPYTPQMSMYPRSLALQSSFGLGLPRVLSPLRLLNGPLD